MSFDLIPPNISFVELARGFNVPGLRVEKPEDIGPAIDLALSTDGPFLIDLVVSSETPGHEISCRCGQ